MACQSVCVAFRHGLVWPLSELGSIPSRGSCVSIDGWGVNVTGRCLEMFILTPLYIDSTVGKLRFLDKDMSQNKLLHVKGLC